MSVTYTDTIRPAAARPEPQVHVPVYARAGRARRNKPVKTWMILAPLGLLVMGGAAALMLTQDSAPGVSAAAPTPAPVLAPMTTNDPAALAPAPAPASTPAPVVDAPRVAEPSPARVSPAAPAQTARPAAPPAMVVEAPVQPTGPRPYVAEAPPTMAAPRVSVTPATPAPAPTPPPPVVITPQG